MISDIPEPIIRLPRLPGYFWAGDLDESPQEIDWAVKKLILATSLVIVHGQPGSGKSQYILGLLASVAHGRPFCDRETQQGAVVYVAGEGMEGFGRRVRAYHQRHGLDLKAAPILIRESAVQLRDDKETDQLIADVTALARGQRVRFLVLDTLSRCFVGGEENLQSDVSKLVAACDRIQKALGCAVVLIHHQNKAGTGGPRGSTVLTGAADTIISIARIEGGFEATVEKLKEGRDGQKFRFAMETEVIGIDEDGNEDEAVVGVFVDSRSDEPTKSLEPRGRIQAALRDLLAKAGPEGLTEAAWFDEAEKAQIVGGAKPKRAFTTAKDVLVEGGFVIETEGRFVVVH